MFGVSMWKYAAIVLIVCLGLVLPQSTDESRVVKIAQGAVRGHLDPEGGVYNFYNIPYATAPTGINRFKAPLAPPVWMHTFDAVNRRIMCPQPGSPLSIIQEDCLIANVFTPVTNETNLPVMVSVHGGAYQFGFGNLVKFISLVRTGKLIVVSFNYRLGAHGFLCLGTEGAPGNAGLKDQVALLRWVQRNIASFGGNPDDVTLLGCSAGSGSIDILTLSKITNGLFKKAILESGAAYGAVGVQSDPIANAQNYARLLGFNNTDNIGALENFYRAASFQQLYSRVSAISGNENSQILFSPCVERDVGEERVLEDAPINIVNRGDYEKIPLLYGFANMEGLMRIGAFSSWKNRMNDNFAEFLPGELHFESEEEKARVAARVKTFYFGDEPVSEGTVLAYIDYFTDVLFAYPMLKGLKARMESLDDTIFLYEYSFVDENSSIIPHTNETGAEHCDQTRAVIDEDKTYASADYERMKEIMREYWLNFILTGSPWVEGSYLVYWPRTTANRSPHMSLGRAIHLIPGVLTEGRAALWDSVYEEHYRAPRPPGGSAASLIASNIVILLILCTFYFLS